MKKIFTVILFIIILTSCYMSPTAIKYYQPVIEISLSDTLEFSIDPGEDDIWNWEDEDSINLDVIFTETEGIDAFITEVSWSISDYNGNTREHFTKIFTAPQELKANTEDTLKILFFLNGHYANDLDEEDGAEDGVAYGIAEINVKFYDNNGVTFTSRSFYRDVIAVKP
ncbi:MAG: hypothetical protein AB7T10_00550 [bacterium]